MDDQKDEYQKKHVRQIKRKIIYIGIKNKSIIIEKKIAQIFIFVINFWKERVH